MRKSNILYGLSFICSVLSAQEFHFQMFFKDAAGNRDTIELGYDPFATDSLDFQFGEENIITRNFKGILDVRISNEYSNNRFLKMPGT